jgi:hypothetical protein
MTSEATAFDPFAAVNKAFSKQSVHYDYDDFSNPVLTDMRLQVYAHVREYLRPASRMLELNAGTGIDATYFASLGHQVHATDVSTGMIHRIQEKITHNPLDGRLTCQQLSYDQLDQLSTQRYDYVFSNFGGLNCIADLSKVTASLASRLNENAYVTWVIMPPVSLWELAWIFKGNFRAAFRRWHREGVMAHLEGEYFKTYYHSLGAIEQAFGKEFRLVRSEGLCVISPPPAPGDFPLRHPKLYRRLRRLDGIIRHCPVFNRTGDHLIVTFQKR